MFGIPKIPAWIGARSNCTRAQQPIFSDVTLIPTGGSETMVSFRMAVPNSEGNFDVFAVKAIGARQVRKVGKNDVHLYQPNLEIPNCDRATAEAHINKFNAGRASYLGSETVKAFFRQSLIDGLVTSVRNNDYHRGAHLTSGAGNKAAPSQPALA